MDQLTKRYAATNANLLAYALEPSMRWLIATALDNSTVTYGELKARLEEHASFSTIFATRIGVVAGALMEAIQEVDPNAPLINVLVVNQQDQMPSKGAGAFMARRFKNPQLGSSDYKKRRPLRWKSYFDRAAAEVYGYSFEQWAQLYQRTFGRELAANEIEAERKKRKEGAENDFGTGSGKYGKGGESDHHRALRLWVTAHPELIRRAYAGARAETEFELESADRVDAVYHLPDRTVVLEVKSRISNAADLRRGVYQCIKYRAVKAAMDVRADVPVEAVLVTETEVPGEIAGLLKKHGIMHHQAPQIRR